MFPTNLGHLAMLVMVDDNGKQYSVYFSEIAGEKCTYSLSQQGVEAYGDDASLYMNFFGSSYQSPDSSPFKA